MTLEQAQHVCGMLLEDGYHCWIVEGYHINLLLDKQLYTIKRDDTGLYQNSHRAGQDTQPQ